MHLSSVEVRFCCGPCRVGMGLVPQVAQGDLRVAEWAQACNPVAMAEPHQGETPVAVAELQATRVQVGAAAMV